MDKKSKIILILLVITLLSLSSYASLSRFSKGINKNGSIQTTELEYCQLNEIETLGECLIRNDSKQELSLALDTIDERTSRLDLSKIEPINVFAPTTRYINVENKTNSSYVASVHDYTFNYVVESKLINPFNIDDNEIENISFSEETGRYTYTNPITGDINDIITTEEDMANNIYKYTCLNTSDIGNCINLYLFTESPYLILENYLFKQGYMYSNIVIDTTSMNAGLYKGDDDYTVDEDTYTYYYRGDVNNNWVKFGNYLWRVVRINGDGTIRMIYSGLESSTHTGKNAYIGPYAYSKQNTYDISFSRLTNTNDIRTLSYQNGGTNLTYAGYMYNPSKVLKTFPDKIPSNENSNKLNSFPTYEGFGELKDHYFFKNFDPEIDCNPGNGIDDSGVCVLKCNKLGEYGDVDADCVYSTWKDLYDNPLNYSDTAPGVYKSGDMEYDIYQMSDTDGGYRYVCLDEDINILEFSEGDLYSACSNVIEIVGIVKGKPSQAKVKIHGVFAENEEASNTNVLDSNIKENIETWYESNIYNQKDINDNYLEDYLADSIFCNDRNSSNSATFPLSNRGSNYFLRPYSRIIASTNPSFKCLNLDETFDINDAFTLKTSGTESTVEASGIGNNMLAYPVGLLTVDEAAFAGGKYSAMNKKYYLYIGVSYWTMSPSSLYMPTAGTHNFLVSSNGSISYTGVIYNYGVRPVINLKSDILYKGGDGTKNNPYIIEPNN